MFSFFKMVDVALMLNKMPDKIYSAGTGEIIIILSLDIILNAIIK
jgi:hypothetical protein